MFEFGAGYSALVTPEREEYLLMRAARYAGVPPWEMAAAGPYWRNLALACEMVDGEVEEHLMRKARRPQ